MDELISGAVHDPHATLGAHPTGGETVIRTLRRGADDVAVLVGDQRHAIKRVHDEGVFEAVVPGSVLDYRLDVDGPVVDDPYRYVPTVGELDLHLIGEGHHEQIYDRLGAHVREHQGVTGTAFAVWAPAARAVSVVGDFNSWDGRLHAMRSMGPSGIWEIFVPDVGPGARYKYEILSADHELLLKADPYAQETEIPPKTASVITVPRH